MSMHILFEYTQRQKCQLASKQKKWTVCMLRLNVKEYLWVESWLLINIKLNKHTFMLINSCNEATKLMGLNHKDGTKKPENIIVISSHELEKCFLMNRKLWN